MFLNTNLFNDLRLRSSVWQSTGLLIKRTNGSSYDISLEIGSRLIKEIQVSWVQIPSGPFNNLFIKINFDLNHQGELVKLSNPELLRGSRNSFLLYCHSSFSTIVVSFFKKKPISKRKTRCEVASNRGISDEFSFSKSSYYKSSFKSGNSE